MEGPAGGDHFALRDVVKDDFSTRLFLFVRLFDKKKNVIKNSARPRVSYTHGVKN